MRRSTAPTEIVLGFFMGMFAALLVELPFVWFLHLLHLTARTGFSSLPTAPLGVAQAWSRIFWGGAFGIALAGWGLRYDLGLRWFVSSVVCIVVARTFIDWFVAPMMLHGHVWIGWSVDGIVLTVVLNIVWAVTAAIFLAASTLAAGTWGWTNPT